MLFFACGYSYYLELEPLYKYCINRVYPNAKIIVQKIQDPSFKRFLISQNDKYVHITDLDILILPHKKTHEEYYSQFMVNGASYLRGATESHKTKWTGELERICGGHFGATEEFYQKTKTSREKYMKMRCNYREHDEVMLANILKENGYPIPENPYTFPNGKPWDPEYRDLHLNDFSSFKYLKWKPNKEHIKQLIKEKDFQSIVSNFSSYWKTLIEKVQNYALSESEDNQIVV